MRIQFEAISEVESKFDVTGANWPDVLFEFFTELEQRYSPLSRESYAEFMTTIADAWKEIVDNDISIGVGRRREFSDSESNFDITIDID